MFNFLNIFNKKKEIKLTEKQFFKTDHENKENNCKNCPLSYNCNHKKQSTENCEHAIDVSHIDFEKDVILLIDDNNGVISFLEDDIEYYKEEDIIPEDLQVLSITGSYAAFSLELLMDKLKILKIKYAIIDITLGGSKQSLNGNVKYTGVDVFNMIYKNNPELKYIFYTGNNLNPYIKSNEALINKYYKITGKDIADSVLYKTSIDMDTRRKYVAEKLFKEV
jgi:hypothetical protein